FTASHLAATTGKEGGNQFARISFIIDYENPHSVENLRGVQWRNVAFGRRDCSISSCIRGRGKWKRNGESCALILAPAFHIDPSVMKPDQVAHNREAQDRKSTRLNSSHVAISYAV